MTSTSWGARAVRVLAAATALTAMSVAGASAVRVNVPSLDEWIRRSGGSVVARYRDQRVDTLRSAGGRGAIAGGTWLVATTGDAPVQTAIAGGLRQSPPLEVLTPDAADSKLLALRLVVESDYSAFRFDRAAGRFETVIHIGLRDTIAEETARLARPVLVQITGTGAEFVEPTEFFLDHAGVGRVAVRIADSTARHRLPLSLRSEFDGKIYEFGIPFEEPARISLARDRLPGFGFGGTDVIVEAPEWADSVPMRLRAGRALVLPGTVTLKGGSARARLHTRFTGFDSVTVSGGRLAARTAHLNAEWPARLLPMVALGALAGFAWAAVRSARRRHGALRHAAAAAIGAIAAVVAGVGALQFTPLPIPAEAVTLVLGALGGVVACFALERFVPPPTPPAPRTGPSHLRKWEVESTVPADDEGARG